MILTPYRVAAESYFLPEQLDNREDFQQRRAELLKTSRRFLGEQTRIIRDQHEQGASGTWVVDALTCMYDTLVGSLYRAAAADQDEIDLTDCALIALGGYGRMEMNPRSDLDLMFYYEVAGKAPAELISDRMLYLLWDLKLDVGYSIRSTKDCLENAVNDLTVRTALLDARFLAGSALSFAHFENTVARPILHNNSQQFIRRKLEENDERLRKYGSSVYVLEPNIKEGEGGLRDLHAALWIARVKFKAASLNDLLVKGVLTAPQAEEYRAALDYLWRIRNQLHFLLPRKNDQIQFDQQRQIAEFLGYVSDRKAQAVEKFMQDFYTRATEIEHLASTLIVKATQKENSQVGMLGFFVRRSLEDGFYILRGELGISNTTLLKEQPALIMKAFELTQKHNARLNFPLKQLIRECLPLINDKVRRSRTMSEAFLRILRHSKGVGQTLRNMHHLHVLHHFIPEFKRIFCKVQFDVYHIYTVDIHSLFAVEEICKLWDGDYINEFPQLTQLAKDVEKHELLLLAVLFHDIGKGEGKDHSTKGASMIPTIARRLGLNREDTRRLQFLVQHHLDMTLISQRRDLNDMKMIAQFAELMGMSENLKMLYLLTFADVRAVGPEVWSNWKGQLLQELYEKTFDILEKGDFYLEKRSEKVRNRKRKVKQMLLEEFPESRVSKTLGNLSTLYVLSYRSREIVNHLRLSLGRGKKSLAMQIEQHPEGKYTEVVLSTIDMPGLFSLIAGVMSAHAINILGAQIHTRRNGVVLDVLQVNSPTGEMVTGSGKWKRVEQDLTGAIEGRVFVEDLVAKRKAPTYLTAREKPRRPNRVEIDNEVSEKYSVIDVFAHDKVGLLYDITRTLNSLGLYIAVSKISTKVDQVADVFYVHDIFGQKLSLPEKQEEVRKALLDRLNGSEGSAEAEHDG